MDSTRQSRYRPDIDGLRAVAILSVVLYHAGIPGIGGGFVGVDVFFVISGFLITRLLLGEIEATGRIHLGAFIARRVRRLLPAFVAVVLGTLALAALTMFPQELPRLAKSAMAAALISANVHFLKFSGGYFDPSTDLMPMLHTWSLGVEEQYYLVWPLLFMVVWYLGRHAGGQPRKWIAYLFGALFAASFLANVLLVGQHKASVFYLMPFRAWEFALGGGINWLSPRLAQRGRGFGEALFLAGIAAVVGSALFLQDAARYPGWLALVPTLGASAVIAGGSVSAARWPTAILGSRGMVAIGLLSYSWYLWHWPLLSLTRAHDLGARSLPRDVAVVLAALALSWATYRAVEVPIRFRKPWLFGKTRGTLAAGAAMVVLMLAAAGAVAEYGKRQAAHLTELAGQGNGGGDLKHLDMCPAKPPGQALDPNDACLVGQPADPVSLVAWGDSHATHWLPLFAADAKPLRSRVLMRVFPSCPPLLGAVPYKERNGVKECGESNDTIIEELGRMAAGGQLKGVVIAARWNEYLARQETDPGAMAALALADDWQSLDNSGTGEPVGVAPYDFAGSAATEARALRRTLEALAGLHLRVLIVAPVPELYFHGPQCLYLRSADRCVVPRERVDERRAAALAAIRQAGEGLPGVRVWDPIDEFCDRTTCYTQRNGIVQYTDHNHVSPRKATELGKAMHSDLLWLLGAAKPPAS